MAGRLIEESRFVALCFVFLAILVGCVSSNNLSDQETSPVTAVENFNEDVLVVTHTPNPSDKHWDENFPEPYLRYMWYYRTEVKNVSDVPLRVIWFDAYVNYNGNWFASNVLNRTLRADDFLKWYAVEDPEEYGWIYPGESAVCDVNWHGSTDDPNGYTIKWAYIAVDAEGNDYYAEAIVESVPIESEE